MNKLLQYMIGAGNVSDKFLPQLTKAQKGFTALPTDLNRYDNIPNPTAVRANAEKLMQFKKAQAAKIAAERQGTITQAAPKRSAASKTWAIATNPMTALSYKAKGLDIPENFERGSRNSLDMALDMVNPFGYANTAAAIPGDIMEGNLASAGLKAATLLPFMSELRGASKSIVPKNSFISQNSYFGNPSSSIGNISPLGILKDYTKGLVKGMYLQTRPTNTRPLSEAFPLTKAQRSKVMGMQDEALEDAKNFTNNYWYDNNQLTNSGYLRPVLEDKIRRILPEVQMAKYKNNLFKNDPTNPIYNSQNQLAKNTTFNKVSENLDQETIDYINRNRGSISGVQRDGNKNITLRNHGLYYQSPKGIANVVVHEAGHSAQNFGIERDYMSEILKARAQGKEYIPQPNTVGQVLGKFDPELGYFTSNPETELGKRFQNALVEPKAGDYRQTWRSSPNELHSELMASKYNLYKRGIKDGIDPTEMMQRVTNPMGRELDWLLNKSPNDLNKFFKQSTPVEERLKLLKLLPAAAPVVAGAALSQQKYGGQPCYECGGSIKKYDMGGYYDCPDQEKDPETGKCKAEVVRGREAAAANTASADMNAWAKQVAAMDKEVARQNAAQAAGQLTFDYDWMQSPVDKADKKAAMAQYKQFFQQNPNVFVADDSSGYSPEQKYIIASKLKQRMSTPMGSKLIQQKYGVDPKFYDLQRIQSDFAPKMGGWEGMRNFLFNVYKQQGGPILDPRGQWAHPGKVTRIPGSNITMQGVNYPVYGVGSNGQEQMMYPDQEYDFGGASYVDEYPMMQNGGGILSKSVICSNCGHSWKAVDGGIDPMTCHKCGGVVKMQIGGTLLQPITAQDMSNVLSLLSVPQKAITKLVTGKYQTPSEAMNIKNPVGAFATDMILDPVNLMMGAGALRQAIKFKPTSGMMYRGLGEEGFKDAIESGVFRPKQHNYPDVRSFAERVSTPKQFGSTYYAPANNFEVIKNYGPNYIAEVPFDAANFGRRYGRKDWSWSTGRQIPINEGRILKKDWLRGYKEVKMPNKKEGGQHGGLDRWFAEKWVDVKTGKACGRQEGESRAGYPACRPSKRVNSQTPKTSSEMSSAEKAKFKASKTSSQRINYNHKRNK